MSRNETTAACITLAAAIVVVVLLMLCGLSFDPSSLRQPPRPTTEVAEIDEEFVEFFDYPVPVGNPSRAYSSETVQRESSATDASGTDLTDAGEAAAPAPDVVSDRPSPIARPKKETPVKTGPTKAELEAEARRRARQGISNAFKNNDEASDNTTSKGKDKGDSGAPDGSSSAVDGAGSGSVGGGWIMPAYAKVRTSLTGSIILRAVIDDKGHVIKIEQTGGKAPAGADGALVAKCIAEVKRHTFKRNDNDAPPTATARIVYTFR